MNDRSVDINMNSTDLYEYMYGANCPHTMYYVVLVLIFILGPVLCIPIVLYEMYGGDRQKRTIINQLFSRVFLNIAIQSCIWSIIRLLRDVFGLLSDKVDNLFYKESTC